MKNLLSIILFVIKVSFGQSIPHDATLTASKDSILSDETFLVTYILDCPPGYIYI